MALDSITGMPTLPITRKFVESLPKTPKGYVGAKEILPMQEELGGVIAKAKQDVGKADIDIEKAKREEKARELDVKAKSLDTFAKDVETMPEKVALKELREQQKGMEFIPTKDTAKDVAGLFSLIGVIGMVLGRSNAQRALGAMNGMLEGHMKGRKDLFKQEQAEFEKNFKAMQAKVSSALAEFQEALEIKKINKEAGEAKAQAALARTESPFLKAVYDKQGPVATLERLMEANKSITETAPKLINDLQKYQEERAAKAAEIKQRQENFETEMKFKEKQLEQAERLAKLKSNAKLDDVAAELDSLGVHIADKKDRAQIQQTVNAMATLKELQKEVTENPNFVGRQGQIKRFTERYIESFKTGAPEPTAANKDEQEALLFSKKYASMLTRYEQALAGSAKSGSTVFFQKRYNDLLSQDQFNPASMVQLFNEMQIEAARGAMEKSPKITYQMMDDLANRFNTRLGTPESSPATGDTAATPPAPANNPKPANAPADAKKASDNHWYSPDPNRPGKYIRWD